MSANIQASLRAKLESRTIRLFYRKTAAIAFPDRKSIMHNGVITVRIGAINGDTAVLLRLTLRQLIENWDLDFLREAIISEFQLNEDVIETYGFDWYVKYGRDFLFLSDLLKKSDPVQAAAFVLKEMAKERREELIIGEGVRKREEKWQSFLESIRTFKKIKQ